MEDEKKSNNEKFAKGEISYTGSGTESFISGTEKNKQKYPRANNPRDADNQLLQDQTKGEYHRRDTYHRSEETDSPRKPRKQREHNARERVKGTFEKETFDGVDGCSKSDFLEGSDEFGGSKKLKRMEKDLDKAKGKTDKARKKVQMKEYRLQKKVDETTGKVTYSLDTVNKNKKSNKNRLMKKAYYRMENDARGYVHGKVAEQEKDNSGVEAAHKTEQKAEDAVAFVAHHHKSKLERDRAKLAKLEKAQFQKEVNFNYQKFLEENPEMNEQSIRKAAQRRFQKKKIQREHAQAIKAAKAGKTAKEAKDTAVEAQNLVTVIAKKIQEMAQKYGSVIVVAGIIVALLMMIMTSVSSCGAMLSNGTSMVMGGSYQSKPAEMDAVTVQMSEYEAALQLEINNIETDYPDYDEYNYDLGEIGHSSFTLLSYLTAVHTDFTAEDVKDEVEAIFNEMYELKTEETEETRTRTVTKTGTRTVTDPDTGEEVEEEYEYEEEEEYTVTVLNVTLTVKTLEEIVEGKMTADQKALYDALNVTKGLTQVFYSPLDLYWYNYILHGYGYMVDPATGTVVFNKGIDISVPEGTNVYAAMDGTVTEAAYNDDFGNYIVIENSDGYCTKYAHLESMSVSVGQSVVHGRLIGKTGATGSCLGSELHLECLYNGEYYNPLLYFETGEATLYGEGNAGNGVVGDVTPPSAYDDATVAALMAEAAKYVGMPYVWGGSNPSTSFDCSGFVCYVFKNSGVYPLERTNAQGIYNKCTPVSASEAKAGDIIFFTGTYNSGSPVSHVGIYCGDGIMVHAGNPIKYASINTSYWQSHFYAFGRLN